MTSSWTKQGPGVLSLQACCLLGCFPITKTTTLIATALPGNIQVLVSWWICWDMQIKLPVILGNDIYMIYIYIHVMRSTYRVFHRDAAMCTLITARSREVSKAARFEIRFFKLFWNLTGTSAATMPRCLSNFRAINITSNLAASRLHEVWR